MASKCRILLVVSLILVFAGVAAAQSMYPEQVQKLLAEDGEAGDNFGGWISMDGGTTVVSAEWDDDKKELWLGVRVRLL